MTSTTIARTTDRSRWVVPDGLAFWGIGALIATFLFAAAAPSPLYATYAVRWGFSASTLTIIFSVYAFGLLAGLLVTGRLSDHLGRRPVILAGIGLEIVAMLMFVLADSTFILAAARTVQGVATGIVLGVLSAQLVELASAVGHGLAPVVNSAAPTLGLAFGALGSSVLVQFGPAPLRLVYTVILAALVVGLVFVALMRETGVRRPGAWASLRPVAEIPAETRSTFARITPSLVALWALSGFYLSLAPGLISSIEESHNLLWGGFAIFSLCLTAAASVVLGRDLAAWTAMFWGCVALFVGVGLTAVAIALTDGPFFIAATVVAGAGFGLAFLGSFRAVMGVTPAAKRAGTLASFYIVSYVAFSVPVVLAGIAETHDSPHDVALVFSAVVAVLAGLGILASAPRLADTSEA